MKTAFFSTQSFERQTFATDQHQLVFLETALDPRTARLAEGCPAACLFVNDRADRQALEALHQGGTRFLALRSAGYNHVDLEAARQLGIQVARVPAYSPHAVAEHAIALMLCLNRKIHRAYQRTREHNFRLDGLMGFDVHGRTVGLIGVGKIGSVVQTILRAFGCRVLVHDPCSPESVPLEQLLPQCDILSLHCPLTPETHHLIGAPQLALLKKGAMLINTGRGALVDTPALIEALKTGQLGSLALDVYEEEETLFFRDLSEQIMQDETLARLLTFPNVLITGHQGFYTQQALTNIATTTLANLTAFEHQGQPPESNRIH